MKVSGRTVLIMVAVFVVLWIVLGVAALLAS
jgi:hypothetical protein